MRGSSVALAGALLLTGGCIKVQVNLGPSRPGPLEETTVAGSGKQRILLVDITGEISGTAQSGGVLGGQRESLVSLVHEQLLVARRVPALHAIVLRVNSPGGTVGGSDQLYRELKRFRDETGIPIYAAMMDVAASGGYYAAMAADRVYAQPTTITGSIGVIMVNVSVEGLMQKIGVKSKVVKSGENKDVGSPLHDFSPAEREILQGIIDDLYARFVDVVAAGRPGLARDRVREIADGRVYTATQAHALGLVDEIAYLPEVIEAARQAAGLETARVVVFHRPGRQVSNIYSRLDPPAPSTLALVDTSLLEPLAGGASRQGFYYLWRPGL